MTEIRIDKIIRSARKTIGLEITRDASLVVRAPKNATIAVIEHAVSEKSRWIIEKQHIVRQRLSALPPRTYTDGDEFLFLGRPYPLVVADKARLNLAFEDFQFVLKARRQKDAPRLFYLWYRRKAAGIIPSRVNFWADKCGIGYSSVRISWAVRRWGSALASTKSLNFSWRLAMAPLWVIDYVVVHELCHLKEPNHSRRFWNHVTTHYPDYRKAKKWLVENGPRMYLERDDGDDDADEI